MAARLRPLFRPVLGAAQVGQAARAAPRALPPLRSVPSRSLHSSPPLRARYERFDNGFRGPTGPSGRPGPMDFLRRRFGSDRVIYMYGIGLGGAGIYYIFHLERVPETGRLRFIDVSEASERELGEQTQLQTLSEYSGKVLSPNSTISRRVRKVATRIIESNGLGQVKAGNEMGAVEGKVASWGGGEEEAIKDVMFGGGEAKASSNTEWEVYVIDDRKTKNAFVLPGGKIFVFTGILPVSANDDGLATVLGHEIAHQVARHPAERMSYMKVLFAVGLLLESLGLDVGVTRLAITFMLQLPNSRKSESEADFIGLRLMSRACFNPEEAPKMWERMSQGEGRGSSIDFMSTHPANAKRIKQLTKWMPEAQEIRARSHCGSTSSSYGSFLDSLNPSNVSNQPMGKTFWG